MGQQWDNEPRVEIRADSLMDVFGPAMDAFAQEYERHEYERGAVLATMAGLTLAMVYAMSILGISLLILQLGGLL